MSGTDSSSETSGEASTPASPPTQQRRGVEPPTSAYVPPPSREFGVGTTQPTDSTRAVVDSVYGPTSSRPSAPQSTSRPWAIAAIVAGIVVVLVLIVGLVAVGIGSVLSLTGGPGVTAPTSEPGDSDPSSPNQDPVDSAPASGSVESTLQATIDEYKSARDDGSLWTKIPDSEFNRTAVSAFLYFLTDLRLAASFGGDSSDYLEQADELEQKLLNQEPLGSDISIKLSDRTFTYDGETGEGGYTTN